MKHDGVEAWEIVGSLLLNNLANKFDKNCLGLYRIDELVIFKILMTIVQLKYVKKSTNSTNYYLIELLSLEIEYNLKTVSYLDITLNFIKIKNLI